jgi:3-deoxy-7-phosphoheptulonate synthase
VAAGADGLIIEVHHEPEKAMSDGAQSLYPEQFEALMQEISGLKPGGWR